MQTVNWGKYAKLYPAKCQLIVTIAKHMSADIVTPPAISNIGSCAGKIRLEIQGLPGYDTITGEAYWISV